MPLQHLKAGLDPTGLPCISVSALLQMIENAQPYPNQGFVIWSDSAPDVVTNPEFADFLWGKTIAGAKTDQLYYYDSTSWQALPFEITDGSIPLTALSLIGSSPNYIIQVNSLGTALTWVSILNAIANNTFPTAKLLTPDNTNNYVLTSLLGTPAFTLITALVNQFAANSIALSKLVNGAANLFLRMAPDASSAIWTTTDLSDLLAAGALAGQVPRRNAGNTGWEYVSALSTPVFGGSNEFLQSTADIDVSFALPAGKSWTRIELFAVNYLDSASGAPVTLQATLKWNCGTLLNTPVTISAPTGVGDSGHSMGATNDAMLQFNTRFFGVIPAEITSVNPLVVRGSIVLGGTTTDTIQYSWRVFGTAYYS